MSEQTKRTELNDLGEFALIEHLTKTFHDAAVIHNGDFQTVVSTDLLVEGIHFDLAYVPLKHLGYKAVVVNLSDIYAMNAIPKQITVSLALSSRFSVEALEELYAGIRQACEFYKVDLVGGDTTSSLTGLLISVTAVGQGEADKLVYRNGAKPGDILCMTGDLGGAYLGLQVLEREKQIYLEHPDVQPELKGHDYIIGKQLKPEARHDAIEQFAKAQLVPTAMIDISDGLASEILHICKESGVGAFIEEGHVMINQEVFQTALDFRLDPITCALSGGEDYELLFTIDEKDLEKVRFMNDIAIIGEITKAKDGATLHTKGGNIHALKAQGWKHF